MSDIKIEKHYQLQAKDLIDNMFDANMFNENLTRDDINSVEDTFAYLLQSNKDSSIRIH